MKKAVTVVVIVIVIIIGIFLYSYLKDNGVPIAPSTTREDTIIVVSPIKDSKISSPLSVAGRAKGTWFFEGSFPLILKDQGGKTIAEGHVSSQGDWQTENLVKFIGTIQFDQPPSGQKGVLIFKKDNPSDLSQNDDSYELPVIFK